MTSVYLLAVMAVLDFALYASFRRRGMHRQAQWMLVMGALAVGGIVFAWYMARMAV